MSTKCKFEKAEVEEEDEKEKEKKEEKINYKDAILIVSIFFLKF